VVFASATLTPDIPMKLLLVSLIALSTTGAFAARCIPTNNPTSRCDIQVEGRRLAECRGPGHIHPNDGYRRQNNPGNYPGTYIPDNYTRPWRQVDIGEESSVCDVSIEDCQYFAFRALEKFEYTNNCGATSVGKSVEYRYSSLNNDGTVADVISGRMVK
jgi:hypothetical protein